MINEVPNMNSSSIKSISKNNREKANAPDEKIDRMDVYDSADTVDISGYKPNERNMETKVPPPVNGEDDKVALKADVKHTGKNLLLKNNEGKEDESPTTDPMKLNEEEVKEVEDLKKRDGEVRQHENAHMAAAGTYSQGVSFEYEAGPDGRRYAVGGEVKIDTSEVPNDPDATIAKAGVIRKAATAPAEPSAQDRQVAAAASKMEANARTEKMQESIENGDGAEKDISELNNIEPDGPDNAGESDRINGRSLISAYGREDTGIGKFLNKTA